MNQGELATSFTDSSQRNKQLNEVACIFCSTIIPYEIKIFTKKSKKDIFMRCVFLLLLAIVAARYYSGFWQL